MPDSPSANPLPPLAGGILIGGASRRMGRPKALLEWAGRTFVEQIAATLRAVVPEIVLLGSAPELPAAVAHLPAVADHSATPEHSGGPGSPERRTPQGPIAGLLAALDLRPDHAWLILSCDQPLVTVATLTWLVGERRPGRLAVLARRTPDRVEPFPGIYEPACRPFLAALAASGRRSLQPLGDLPGVHVAALSGRRAAEWSGVNTPAELRALRRRGGGVDGFGSPDG